MPYLDHAATTPMLPEAVDLMAELLGQVGNTSSLHAAGRRARAEQVREIQAGDQQQARHRGEQDVQRRPHRLERLVHQRDDADADLTAFRNRMAADALARARDAAFDRRVRERFGLPIVAFS